MHTGLFVPWGSGNGHVMRMLALSSASDEISIQPVITVRSSHEEKIVRSHGAKIAYLDEREFSQSGCWADWDLDARISQAVRSDLEIIDSLHPDFVIYDGRPSIPISCWIRSIPCTAVLQSIHFPSHRYIGRPIEKIWTSTVPSMNKFLSSLGAKSRITDLRQLIAAPPSFIPSFPEFDALGSSISPSKYIGPLTGASFNRLKESSSARRPTLFLYGFTPKESELRSFAQIFSNFPGEIGIASPSLSAHNPLLYDDRCGNIHIQPFWNIEDFSRAEVAITHGGHGISLTMLQLGIPSVVIPGESPERRENAYGVVKLGAGISILDKQKTTGDKSWEAHDSGQNEINWSDVAKLVEQVRSDISFKKNAKDISLHLKSFSLSSALRVVSGSAQVPQI